MKKYNNYLIYKTMEVFELDYDEKITTWVRYKYVVKAKSLKDAVDAITTGEADWEDVETLHDTEDTMSIESNGDEPTVEILNDNGVTVWDNVNLLIQE